MYGATFRFGNKKDGVSKFMNFDTPTFFVLLARVLSDWVQMVGA